MLAEKLPIKRLRLSHWLKQLERLASPRANIVLCPFWKNDGQRRKIEDIEHNVFTEIMLNSGYKTLPRIKDHNRDPECPITFHKNTVSATQT